MKKTIFKILVSISIATSMCASAQETQEEKEYTFNLIDSNDKSIEVKTFPMGINVKNSKDKIVLLNFFGKNCPPCLMEIPHLIKIQNEYKKNLDIISIHVQETMTKEELASFMKEKKINYTVIDNKESYDFVDYIMAKTGWQGMIPFMVLFDKKGNAVQFYSGIVSEEQLTSDLKQLF